MATTPITLVAVGDEVGLPLPELLLQRLKVDVGDTLYWVADGDRIVLTAIDPNDPQAAKVVSGSGAIPRC